MLFYVLPGKCQNNARRPEWSELEGTGGEVEGVSEEQKETMRIDNENRSIVNARNKLLLLRIKSKRDCVFSIILWLTA